MSAPTSSSNSSGMAGVPHSTSHTSEQSGGAPQRSSIMFKIAKHPPVPGTPKKIGPPVPRKATVAHSMENESLAFVAQPPTRPGNGKMFGSPVDHRLVDVATGKKLFSLPSSQKAAVLRSAVSAEDYDDDAEAIVFVPPTVVQYAHRFDVDDHDDKRSKNAHQSASTLSEEEVREKAAVAERLRQQRRAEQEECFISFLVEGRHADALAVKCKLSDSDDEHNASSLSFLPRDSSGTATPLLTGVFGPAVDHHSGVEMLLQGDNVQELIAQL